MAADNHFGRPQTWFCVQNPKLKRQFLGRFQNTGNVSVNAIDKRLDDLRPVRMIMQQFFVEVATRRSEAKQPSADVAFCLLRTKQFGYGTGRLPTPDFQLKQPVLSGRVALRKEQIVFVFGVNVVDAPAVPDDLDGLPEIRRFERLCELGRTAAGNNQAKGKTKSKAVEHNEAG